MDVSPAALLTNWLPHLPSIIKTTILASLGRTENSEFQDALTQAIVAAARPILRTPAQLGRSQRLWRWIGGLYGGREGSLGLGGNMWVVGYTVPASAVDDGCNGQTREEVDVGLSNAIPTGKTRLSMSIHEALSFAMAELSNSKHGNISYPLPDVVPVETEWLAYRPDASLVTLRSHLSDRETYARLLQDTDPSGPVILYLHGGAHCLMDPSTHRYTTSLLSKHSNGGRIYSIRHRLSPQNPFPAALLDAFTAYLSLICPPVNALHEAVPASRIVLAGDSSGGGLAASLLLLLLTLSRHDISMTLPYHCALSDGPIAIPIPAGTALTSPWLDVTRSLPSTSRNARWDIIAPPPLDSASPPFPPDEVWPTCPPRAETYVHSAELCGHPLVSPLAAKPDMWRGATSVWVACGWEGFTDEVEVWCRRVGQGMQLNQERHSTENQRTVYFNGWEGMPHCFGMMPWNAAGWEAMDEWGQFCESATKGRLEERVVGLWRGTVGSRKNKVVRAIGLDELGLTREGCGYVRENMLTDEVVDELMEKGRTWRIMLEQNMLRQWKNRVESTGNGKIPVVI